MFALGMISEIHLLECVLRVGVAIVNSDKAELYLAWTCRGPGASGAGDEYVARASRLEHTAD